MASSRDTTEAPAGELRQRLREEGWQSDFAWTEIGAGSAQAVVRSGGGASAHRTIAYLPSVRAADGGAGRLWKPGDVPVPSEADAREVMVAAPDRGGEWHSEVLEAPAVTVDDDGGNTEPDDHQQAA